MDAYAVMVYFRVVDAGAILRRCYYCKVFPYVVKNYFIGTFPSTLWVMRGSCVDHVFR